MELRGLKINFLGDSITYGVGSSAPDKVYHAILKEKAGLLDDDLNIKINDALQISLGLF